MGFVTRRQSIFMCHIRDYVFAENKFVSEPIHRASRVVVVDEGREFTRQQFLCTNMCCENFFFIAVFEVNHDRFMFTIYLELD